MNSYLFFVMKDNKIKVLRQITKAVSGTCTCCGCGGPGNKK